MITFILVFLAAHVAYRENDKYKHNIIRHKTIRLPGTSQELEAIIFILLPIKHNYKDFDKLIIH